MLTKIDQLAGMEQLEYRHGTVTVITTTKYIFL